MKLLDSLLHSQRWDLSKEMISLTQPPSAQMIPGRREIQLETKHNKIYNKYNIAELQVRVQDTFYCLHRRQMDWGTKVTQYLLAELLSLRQLAESDEKTVRRRGGAEFSTVPGPLPLFFETAWQNGFTLRSQVCVKCEVRLHYTGFREQSGTWLHWQIIFTSILHDICSSPPRLRKSS